ICDDKSIWEALGEAALIQGNHQVVEMAYQRTKNFEKLSFLYLVTGNSEKLSKMMKIAQMRNDAHGHYQTALYLGDIEERIKVLKGVGQTSLAYLTAATHGHEEEANLLRAELESKGQTIPPIDPNAKLLVPPPPICKLEENWPLLATARGPFELLGLVPPSKAGAGVSHKPAAAAFAVADDLEMEEGGAWGEEGDYLVGEDGEIEVDDDDILAGTAEEGEAGWDVEDDLAIPDVPIGAGTEDVVVPNRAQPPPSHWPANSRLVADHVAAGSFESALRLLHDQLGVVNKSPFKKSSWQLMPGSLFP
ncbi:hypothetical protein TELCIR_20701, partial [Teladorsagia circumcincta]